MFQSKFLAIFVSFCLFHLGDSSLHRPSAPDLSKVSINKTGMVTSPPVESFNIKSMDTKKILVTSLKTVITEFKNFPVKKLTTSIRIREILKKLPYSLSEELSQKTAEYLVNYIGIVISNFNSKEFSTSELIKRTDSSGKEVEEKASQFDIHYEIFTLITQKILPQFFYQLSQPKPRLHNSLFFLCILSNDLVEVKPLLEEFKPVRINSPIKDLNLYRCCQTTLEYLKITDDSISNSKFVAFLIKWMEIEATYTHNSNIEDYFSSFEEHLLNIKGNCSRINYSLGNLKRPPKNSDSSSKSEECSI
jgi:hypothetical protein